MKHKKSRKKNRSYSNKKTMLIQTERALKALNMSKQEYEAALQQLSDNGLISCQKHDGDNKITMKKIF